MVRSDFAAFVITFNRPDILYRTILQLFAQTVRPCKILIVNNGERIDLSKIEKFEGVTVEERLMRSNMGPAGAANYALINLSSEGFDWIQWIDDDDPPRIGDLNQRMFNHLEMLKSTNVGIISPVGSYFNQSRAVAVRIENREIETTPYLAVDTVGGNQCMLINSAVIKAGCCPTSALFFGFEETNFCLKVLAAGFKIVVPNDLFLQSRKLAGRWDLKDADIRKVDILPWRNYYSIRNLIYMFLYEFNKPLVVMNIVIRASLKVLYVFVKRGPSRGGQEFYYTSLAIKDGLFKKLGLTVKPVVKHSPHPST